VTRTAATPASASSGTSGRDRAAARGPPGSGGVRGRSARTSSRTLRSYALYLTDQGRAKLGEARQASARHAGQVGASLTAAERRQLTDVLRRLADEQGITEAGLPGPPSGLR
jgi:hypothetical protein